MGELIRKKTDKQVQVWVYRCIGEEIHYLLLKRSIQKGGFWQPITGGIEEGETPIDTVKRELLEEIGIVEYEEIKENVYYFEFEEDGIIHPEYVFGVKVNLESTIRISPEHTEFLWLSRDEVISRLKWKSNIDALLHLQQVLQTR